MTSHDRKVVDSFGRSLRDLRISVTDRCNFRCVYCMPKEIFGPDYPYLEHAAILRYEEIARLAKLFVGLGVRKIRLTGGEPLVRREVEKLVAMLAAIPDVDDLSLTTNGAALSEEKVQLLKDAGLRRITISLDSLDDATFQAMNDVGFPVARVLQAIDNAAAAGLAPIKVNMVVKRGVNEHSVLPMAHHFRGSGHVVRFIEYMDVGSTNGWRLDDVVSGAEIVDLIKAEFPIEPVGANYGGEVAKRWRYTDGSGEIGIISSVTEPFCGGCTRARLSAEGALYTCLFASHGHDLRRLLRGGADDQYISEFVHGIWMRRSDRYSELRNSETQELRKVEMSYIGG
ncbi:MAG: GTP 3',8-cyclase MoaA [Acidiferrobacterales bacterium]|nr:GTP 3',8-cyclase MoaA [Acidiferrobacterales bacterium]